MQSSGALRTAGLGPSKNKCKEYKYNIAVYRENRDFTHLIWKINTCS